MVSWVGMDWWLLAKWFCLYEVGFQVSHSFLGTAKGEKLKRDGGSYATAMANALLMSYLGLTMTPRLWDAPEATKTIVEMSGDWAPYTQQVREGATRFLAWLLYDLVHVAHSWPHLGGVDTVLHHAGFIAFSALCVGYAVCPFPGAWLSCGEVSSIPLNIRWFLINSGYGKSKALEWANLAFAFIFFLTRVVLYWTCLHGFLTVEVPLLLSRGAPAGAVGIFSLLLSGGALLNAYWFVMIVDMATGGGKKARETCVSDTNGQAKAKSI